MNTAQSHHLLPALFLVIAIAAASSASALAEDKAVSEIETVTVSTQSIVLVSRTSAADPQAMGEVMGNAYGTLYSAMNDTGVMPAGPPLSIYHRFGAEEAEYDVAFPVADEDKQKLGGRADVTVAQTYAGRALKAVHIGSYDTLIETYNKIMAHMNTEDLAASGPTWEVYMNDPATTPPADLITEIYFPLD